MDVRRHGRLKFRGSSLEPLEARCLLTADTIVYDGAPAPFIAESMVSIEDNVLDLAIETSGETRVFLTFRTNAMLHFMSVLGPDGAPLPGWTIAETVDGNGDSNSPQLHAYGTTPTSGDAVTIHFDVVALDSSSMFVAYRAEFGAWILDDQSLLAADGGDFELPLSDDATTLRTNFQQVIWAGRETLDANQPWEIYHYDRLSGDKVVTGSIAYNQAPMSITAVEEFPAVDLAQNAFVIEYDSATGNLRAHSQTHTPMTAIEIRSKSGAFQGERPAVVSRTPFDVFTSGKLFSVAFKGELSFDFGPVLPTGLTAEQLRADLLVSGAILPSGGPDMAVYSIDGAAPSVARMSGTTPLDEQLSNYVYAETMFDNPNQLDLIFDTMIHFYLPSSATEKLPLVEYRLDESESWQSLGSYGTEDHTYYYTRQKLIPAAGHAQVHLRIRTGAASQPFELLTTNMRPVQPLTEPVRVWLEVPSKTALTVALNGQERLFNEAGSLVTLASNFAIANQSDDNERYYVQYDASTPNTLKTFQYVSIESINKPDVPLFATMNMDGTFYLTWREVADLSLCDLSNVQWADGNGPTITLLSDDYWQNTYEVSAPVPSGHYTLDLGTAACRTTLDTEIPRYLEFDFESEETVSAIVENWQFETILRIFTSPVGPKATRQVTATIESSALETIWYFESDVSAGTSMEVVNLPDLLTGMYTLRLYVTDTSLEKSTIVSTTYFMHVVASEFAPQVTLTVPGDVNFDGRFDEYDLVLLAGLEYDRVADWEHGDFDCDGRFTTADLAFAMQTGWDGVP